MTKRVKTIVHVAIAIILATVISCITPPEGLTAEAMRFMGIFIGVIWIMLTDVISDFVIGLLGLMLCVITGAIPFNAAVSFFSNNTFLLILAALGLSAAVVKTGLLYRISLKLLNLFPKNYTGQLLAILLSGLAMGPFIPALVSKSALGGPLATSVGEALGFPKKGKGMNGLFAMAYVSFCILGLVYLSGTAFSLLTIGMMSPEDAAALTWLKWFIYALPWGVVVMVLCFIFIRLIYKPEELESNGDPEFIRKKLAELGTMKMEEKISGIILVLCVIGWITSSWTGIEATVIAFTGLMCMFLFGVFTRAELRTKLPWEMILYIGSVLGYAALISSTGWGKWLGGVLGQYFEAIIPNVYVYVIVLAIAVCIFRCVVISQTATFSLFFVFMAPIAATYGIHPFITGFVTSAACAVWNTKYQNATWLAAFAAAGGDDVISYREQFKMSIAYSIILIIAALVAIPFWKMMGLC